MRKQSEVFSEHRYKMTLSMRNNTRAYWMSCINEKQGSKPQKFVQLVDFLLSESDIHGVIFTTMLEIEKKTKLSYTTISKSLQLLEKYKLIEKKHGIILLRIFP